MRRKLLAAAISCVLIVAVAELLARLFYVPPTHPGKAEHDQHLGWKPRAHLTSRRMVKDAAGIPYECRYSTTRDGFREFGNTNEPVRAKVLFIGDSFTHSIDVSNEDAYFRLLADRLDLELFAFGQSGYGTMQELLVVEAFIDELRPRLIVLQVCDNDFIDNHVGLEREARYNLGLRRPYMDTDGAIRARIPAGPTVDLLTRTKIGAWILHRSRRLPGEATRATDAEARIARERDRYPPFRDSLVITGRILERFKRTADEGGADLLAFGATGYQPQLEMFDRLCGHRGVPFSAAAVEALERAVASGVVVTTADEVHWSPRGHAIVAEALEGFVRSRRSRP